MESRSQSSSSLSEIPWSVNNSVFKDKIKTETTNHENYNFEEIRLKTFISWPAQSPVDPARLAKAGFYYSRIGDEVICFSCNGHIKDWKYGDIVQRKHIELFPNCDFVNNISNNVSLIRSKSMCNNIIDKKQRRFSEPFENGLVTPYNGVQKQKSVPETNSILPQQMKNHIDYSKLPIVNGVDNKHNNTGPGNDLHLKSNGIRQTPGFEKMKSEEERLKTFKLGWPLPFIEPAQLAHAGFFYLGKGDRVQCPFCLGIVSKWETGDIPLNEHVRHFPLCSYVLSHTADRSCKSSPWYHQKGTDTCGNYSNSIQSATENNKVLNQSKDHSKLEELGVSIHRGPVHPQQATLAARLRSFISWPISVPVKKEDLAEAGFFYIGISDHTKCFHCDGGLCSWEPGDDPWVEHARWFSTCNFVRLNKGDEFIKECALKQTVQLQDNTQSTTPMSSESHTRAFLPSDVSSTSKVDELMKSSLITAVLETGLFPAYLVRAAVQKELQETGASFANMDQLCEAVGFLREMEALSSQRSIVDDNDDESPESTLNIERHLKSDSPGVETKLPPFAEGSANSREKQVQMVVNHKKENSLEASDKLEEENSLLKDQRLCKICMDKEVGVVFLPCGHLLACTLCAPALKDCPMCRKPIQATVRVYLP